MVEVVLRREKGTPLTSNEADNNFKNLKDAVEAIAVYLDAMSYPDGALPASGKTTSKHPFTTTVATAGSGIIASGGYLTATSGLAYLHTEVKGKIVRQYNANMMWTNNSLADDQIGVMIVADALFQPVSGVQTYANAGAHILIERGRFIFQKRSAAGASTDILFWQYDKPLEYGVLHSFALSFDGITIKFIDGKGKEHIIVPDADILAWWKNWVCIENVASSSNPLKIKSFYASSAVKIDPAKISSTPPAAENPARGVMVKSPTATNIAIGGSYTIVKTIDVVIPGTLVLAVWAMPNILFDGQGLLYVQFDVNGHPASISQQVIAENEAINGVRSLMGICDLSAFTAGQVRQLNMRFATTGTATYRELNSGPPRRVPIVVMPISATF